MHISIKTIVDCLEMASNDLEQFLNTETGEITVLIDDFSTDADEKLAEEIECSEKYVRLPNQYEIHEWKIMESFSQNITLNSIREQLLSALHGKQAFKRFKDTLNRLGISADYYDCRNREYYRIAEEWCRENRIDYQL